VIHRTFRSLDDAPKLVGFTMRQWAALIAATCAVLGFVYVAHVPTKPALTLCVFAIGLPAALTYVSESGGLQLGVLLRDLVSWRLSRHLLDAATNGCSKPRGIVLIHAERDAVVQLGDTQRVEDGELDRLLNEERWGR
jgi:hypothetical protein